MKDLIKNKNYISKIRDDNYNRKLFQFERIYKIEDLVSFFQKSQANMRIPFVVSSKQFLLYLDC